MKIAKDLLRRLVRDHPHSAHIIKAFVPLLEAREALLKDIPPLPPPAEPDSLSFAQGKPWLDITGDQADLYVDEAFAKTAPSKIIAAAIKGLPELKEHFRGLREFLKKNSPEVARLVVFHATGSLGKLRAWCRRHGQNYRASAFVAAHLASAAARRVARAAVSPALSTWHNGYCPICGSLAHASALRGKEGKRWLQCSLCGHEWIFSRTSCPVCGQESLKDLPLFFFEQNKRERAEACTKCGRYLLGVDMRELVDDIPLELLLLCMTPLDLLMQEKGFAPAIEGNAARPRRMSIS